MESPSSPAKRSGRGLWLAGLVALLASALSSAACKTTHREKAPYVLEIEERNRHMEQQFRDGNLLGVADLYADDAVLLDSRGERVSGRDEIDAYWTGIEAPLEWKLEMRRIYGSDTLVYEIGRSHLTTLRDGTQHTSEVDFLLLWKREKNGEWKIALDAYWPVAR